MIAKIAVQPRQLLSVHRCRWHADYVFHDATEQDVTGRTIGATLPNGISRHGLAALQNPLQPVPANDHPPLTRENSDDGWVTVRFLASPRQGRPFEQPPNRPCALGMAVTESVG
jgi:hypothetical protein